jgi:hypothetical protein
MPQPVETSVIVLNWNDRHHLGPCLTALQAQTYRDFEIVLVDNGSTDGSVAFVAERFPAVRIIRNEENVGFTAANNQGLAAAQGRFIATLNNDTVADPGWLAALVATMQGDDRIGACASHMILADRPGVLDAAGIDLDLTGTAWNRGHGRPEPPDAVPKDVFGACAGAALYRRAMLDDVGGFFDPAYFIYYEDVDLAWRAQLRGWCCVYVPEARVLHVHSAAAGRDPGSKLYRLGRNKVWTILRNYPTLPLLLFAPLIAGYDGSAVVYHLLHGNTYPLRGRLAALRDLSGTLAARRRVQARRTIPWTALVRAMTWRPRLR